MNARQALDLYDRLAAQARLTREDHVKFTQAAGVLMEVIERDEAANNAVGSSDDNQALNDE